MMRDARRSVLNSRTDIKIILNNSKVVTREVYSQPLWKTPLLSLSLLESFIKTVTLKITICHQIEFSQLCKSFIEQG